jgi:hypothetical protein
MHRVARFFSVQTTEMGNVYIPNVHRIYKTAEKYSKCPQNVPTFSISRPSKMFPTVDFWY